MFQDLPDFKFQLDHIPLREINSQLLDVLTVSQLTYLQDSIDSIDHLEALDLSNNQQSRLRAIIQSQTLSKAIDMNRDEKEKPKLSHNVLVDSVRYRIINILDKFMKLSSEEI